MSVFVLLTGAACILGLSLLSGSQPPPMMAVGLGLMWIGLASFK